MMVVLHKSQVTGTDKPIVVKKEENMFTYEEIVYLNENTVDYTHVAFLSKGTDFYEKLYSKK